MDEPLSSTADGALEDVWGRTLNQISTRFGKLVYLASLRDQNSGTYRHYGLAQIYGGEEASRALRVSHERNFAAWLNFSLEQQRSELKAYLSEESEDDRAVLETWSSLESYRALIPAGAGEPERHLYLSDLKLVLELMRSELSASS